MPNQPNKYDDMPTRYWVVTSLHGAAELRSVVGAKTALGAIRVHCQAMEKEYGIDLDETTRINVNEWTPQNDTV